MEPKLIEYFNQHWYKVNDEYFPSITTKLGIIDKPFLARWRGDIGNREADYRMKDAQEKGSNIHHAWFVMTTDGVVVYHNKRKPQFTQEELDNIYAEAIGNVCILHEQDEQVDAWKLLEWHKRLNPEYLHNEITLYSMINKEAGTADKFIKLNQDIQAEINGSKKLTLAKGVYVVDLKTGSTVDDTAYMQMAAYREMSIEMGLFKKEDFAGALIVHTGAKTKGGIKGLATILRTQEELDQDYHDYRLASDLWLRKHKEDRPDVFEFPSIIRIEKEQ